MSGLTATGLTVRDGSRTIVEALDVAVAPGERLAVVGPSGVDVTEVLLVLAGRRSPAAGRVTFDDAPLAREEPPTTVGFVSQDHPLIATLTAAENLLVPLLAAGEPAKRATVERAENQLAALRLAAATWHNLVEQLSGGQQQRVGLARAMVARPKLLVLDHPTSELDPDSVALVVGLLDELAAEGVCCVLGSDDDLVLSSCSATITLS